MEATTRERTTKVFQFLQEFTGLKYKPQRTSDNDSLLWLHSLPQEPEVYNAARLTEREATPDEWLVIRKPKFRSAPPVPPELKDWVTGPVGLPDQPPTVLTQRVITVVVPDDDLQTRQIQETLFLDDDKQVLTAWERYEREWQAWATEERRARAVQDRYSQLFDFHQKLESFGETYELRLGLGYLAWRTPGGSEVRRHLLTARAALTFDALRGVLTVTAAGDGARTSLEQDMLDADERPLAQVQDHIHQALADSGEEVWSATVLPDLLEAWVNAAGERGAYRAELIPPRGAPADPTVHWAPALILRRRGERSLVAAYADIVRQAGQLETIPEPLRRFIEVSDSPPSRGPTGGSGGQRASEVYFPLPANDAQMEIIRKLERQPGVLVQGPPGTGKSHTIVNLVSHLLATDQRVLVTSHTARALKVLRDKFPAELAALCVTHLRGEEGAKATLERSVQEITQRSAHREPEARETARLNTLSHDLEKARKEEDTLLDDLRRIRQGEVGDLNLDGYPGSAQEVGSRLRAQEGQFGWLTELGNPVHSVPLTDTQAVRLLNLLREFTAEEEAELAQRWSPRDTLLVPETFLQFVRDEAEAVATSDRHASARTHPGFTALQDTAPEARRVLLDALRELSRIVQTIHAGPNAWLAGAVEAALKGQAGLWQEVRAQTEAHLPSLLTHGDWLEETTVSGVGARDPQTIQADADTVLAHLQAGGGWGNFLMKPAAVRTRQYLREEIKVGGRAADTPEVLHALLQHFKLHQRLSGLEALWREAGVPVAGSLKRRLVALREAQEALTRLDELQERLTQAKMAIGQVPGLPEPRWWDAAELDHLTAAVQAASADTTAAARQQVLNDLLPALEGLALRPDAHPVTSELRRAIQGRDPEAYSQAYRRTLHLTERSQLLAERDRLMGTLQGVAPTLADELRGNPQDAVWDERLGALEAAWRWLRADVELARLSNPDTEVDVRQRLVACRQRIRDTLRDLATHRAWVNTLNRLTQREQQGLVRWQRAMKSLGKGTGKHAERHRQTARAALEEARTAIPAWIMPLHLVGETFTLKPGMFDVVIVDEASQAGPESLFLTFIAKKIIIVGDDKQIEPEGVGLQTDRLDALVGRFLIGLPAPEILGERKASLFGFGAYTYADRISLREHFRCMPEIIKFSSELSYEDQPLLALRQFGADRLAPLVARHLTDGYTVPVRGDKTNPAEARAIVDQIKACILDPRYRDAEGRAKTIGVISLVGDTQAEEIAGLLRAEVSERELEERKVVCGNAYSFQGDERDVIFLSMVDSPTDGRRASKRSRDDAIFQPRYNVAASRARDQLWLFHSVDLPDLHPEDLRASLIRHVRNPELAQFQPLTDTRIQDLRTEAARPGRARNNAPKPFDSWFEVDVYLQLAERGYRVIPQFEMNGYRIDLVVEGQRGRLAVECDGDHWHGPEQFQADLHRQQVLERAGMQFWRVRGSTFSRDPEAALEDLWHTLDARGVYPHNDPRNFAPAPPVQMPEPSEEVTVDAAQVPDEAKVLAQQAGQALSPEVPDVPPIPDATLPELVLAPHRLADPGLLPHPQDLPSPEPVIEGLRQIIEIEGPMLCRVAYRSYARAAGLPYGKTLQSYLNKAVARGVRQGVFEQTDENGQPGQVEKVVRLRGTPPVVLRDRGSRDFTDIPPLELAALMQEVQRAEPELVEQHAREELFRRVLALHGGERLTLKRRELLELAYQHLSREAEAPRLLA